jgi:hypothetical protein
MECCVDNSGVVGVDITIVKNKINMIVGEWLICLLVW